MEVSYIGTGECFGCGNSVTRSKTVGPPQPEKAKKVKDRRKDRRGPLRKAHGKGATRANRKKVGRKEKESRGETHALGDTRKSTSTQVGNSQQEDGKNHPGTRIGMGTTPGALASGQQKEKERRPRARAKAKARDEVEYQKSRRTKRVKERTQRNLRRRPEKLEK